MAGYKFDDVWLHPHFDSFHLQMFQSLKWNPDAIPKQHLRYGMFAINEMNKLPDHSWRPRKTTDDDHDYSSASSSRSKERVSDEHDVDSIRLELDDAGNPSGMLLKYRRPDGAVLRDKTICVAMMVNDVNTACIGTTNDAPGLAGINSCCGLNVHGKPWRIRFVAELKALGLAVQDRRCNSSLKGIGGSTPIEFEYIFPIGILGQNGQIVSAEVENDIPLLMCRDHQRQLGLNLYADDTVDITALNITNTPIQYAD